MTSVFTAATVALVFILMNVFQEEIAHFFAKPMVSATFDALASTTTTPAGVIESGISIMVEGFESKASEAWSEMTDHLPEIIHARATLVNPLPLPGFVLPLPATISVPSSLPPPSRTESSSSSQTTDIVGATPSSLGSPSPPLPISLSRQSSPSSQLPPSPTPIPTNTIPTSPGIDEYHLYTGNGSIAAGWPHKADWTSYEEMFNTNIPLIINSCKIWHVTPNTLDEILAIHNATLTISTATNTDPRFILAVILQESGGCVRVPTSFYSLRNPGLMQSHNGPATCNEDADPIYPCPYATIEEMIREGTAGTFEGQGMGLVLALRSATVGGNVADVGRYYRAARIYNSGSIDASGDLGKGVATHCYASDVANRLRGWSLGDDGCSEEMMGGKMARPADGVREVKVGLMGVGLRGKV
ncbi:MAG: hypothetical protein Q9182_002855 [Xanthomendoza sp. 2 TL-2023]